VSAREFTVAGAYQFDQRTPLRWVASHMLRYPLLPLLFLASVIAMAASYSVTAVFVGQAFDAVAGGGGVAALLPAALAVLAARLLYGGLDFVNSYSVQYLAQLVERDAREELYTSLLGKSQTFHSRQRVGDIMARATNDVQQLNPMLSPGLALIFEAAVSLVVPLLVIGTTLGPELLVAPIIFLLVFVLALRRYNNQLAPVAGALRGQFGALNSGLAEAVSGIEVVKGYAQEAQERKKFAQHARRYRDLFVQEGGVQARYLPLLLYGLLIGFAFGHALLLYLDGRLTVGQVIAYMGLLEVLRFPTFISLFTFSLVQLGLAGAARILQMIKTETELDENAGGYAAPLRGEVTFDNVSFRYGAPAEPEGFQGRTTSSPETPPMVLKDISFHINPGEVVAIVGQTGSGKTTLTRLVNRIFDTSAGRVLIDGVDVREWNLDSLRSQISTIEQDIFLFSRSIADNIAFGVPKGVTREQIERAAREAQAHDFIASLPDGYDTVIGERGVTLSGGQRQRVAIARAFLTDPRILILDDSTSAIDSATEDEIQKAMRHIMSGRTTLLITHRLSQIRWADRVLVLRRGELAAQGSHDELLATSEAYRRIFARYEETDRVPS
jgi:ATP-binding cassette, subfamily B, bacterial